MNVQFHVSPVAAVVFAAAVAFGHNMTTAGVFAAAAHIATDYARHYGPRLVAIVRRHPAVAVAS